MVSQPLIDYIRDLKNDPNSKEAQKVQRFLHLLGGLFPEEYRRVTDYVRGAETSITIQGRPGPGSIDAYYGHLVIEFERNLAVKAKFDEGYHQLQEYVSGLWTAEKSRARRYVAILSDGLNWHCYYPATTRRRGPWNPEDISLTEKETFSLKDDSPATCEAFYQFIDRHFFRENRIKPTTEAFTRDFGLTGYLWDDIRDELEETWKDWGQDSEVRTAFDQWSRYLTYTYGSLQAEQDLFLRHSYLSVLARFLVAVSVWPDEVARATGDRIEALLTGSFFRDRGLVNMVEEDFFHWVGKPAVLEALRGTWLRLLGQLLTYDFDQLDEDILKGLYQELVDPQDRHDLGEYYTPDWLCERTVDKLVTDWRGDHGPELLPRLMDPTCGSGSFLRAGLRRLASDLRSQGVPVADQADQLLASVAGMDIHPLAVTIAKANYVLAIREILASKRRAAVIPVFLADSLFLPKTGSSEPGSFNFDKDQIELRFLTQKYLFPKELFEKAQVYDDLILLAAEVAGNLAVDPKSESVESVVGALRRKSGITDSRTLSHAAHQTWLLSQALARKIVAKENHIWSFVLRNTYRPAFFQGSFDLIAGNPPWLSYRYITDPDYQTRVRELMLDEYHLAEPKVSLYTHMELATLFLVHATHTFLRDGGRLGFVLPRSIFNGDQHAPFRAEGWTATCDVTAYWDLEDVTPVFNVPTCVVFASHATPVRNKAYPTVFWSGRLKTRNTPWELAKAALTWEAGELHQVRLGPRTALSRYPVADRGGISHYKDQFSQGATIVPRNFYFIEAPPEGDLAKDEFPAKTDPEQAREAKAPWKEVFLSGNVETDLVYRTALSKHVLPFFVVDDLPYVVLPRVVEADQYGEPRPLLVDAAGLRDRGYRGTAAWFARAEKEWKERRAAKAENMALRDRLDYQYDLSSQTSNSRFLVLYNASGQNLSCAVVDRQEVPKFVVDHKTYWFATNRPEEAHYLVGLLNSERVNQIIKPFQSFGSLGERDIHKTPLEIPFPRFDDTNPTHLAIADAARAAANKVAAAWRSGAFEGSLARQRALARTLAAVELADLDRLVGVLLK